MKFKLFLIAILSATANSLFAQNARFPSSGVIEFEKSVNMYALIQKNFSSNRVQSSLGNILDMYKKSNPQFKLLKSTLTFSPTKSLFSPDKDETVRNLFGMIQTEQPNITYTDLATGTFITQKSAFEETFLIKDTTRKINWKLTSEMRTIAGYECRRANAIIMDSLYVVAFYTDRIPVSGGPESFTGLPGMILGIALPHDHVTWFATKVTDREISSTEIKPPVKGKETNMNALKEVLLKGIKNWGENMHTYLKAFLL